MNAGKAFGEEPGRLEEMAMADKRSDNALIMYVNANSFLPLRAQKVLLWIKRHILRLPL